MLKVGNSKIQNENNNYSSFKDLNNKKRMTWHCQSQLL